MIDRISLNECLLSLADLVLPRTCVVCGKSLTLRESGVCEDCLRDLPRTYYSKMPRNPMSARLNSHLSGPVPYSLATALFYYRAATGYRNITKSLKYNGDFATGRLFAGMLASELAGSALYSDVDAVVPVPLHWTRRWSRGYNQAEVIGKVVADALGAALCPDALRRRRRTRTQTRLSIEGKEANVTGAFRPGDMSGLLGKTHVLLVDDVFTTGATVAACVKTLRETLPSGTRISAATLACVGG